MVNQEFRTGQDKSMKLGGIQHTAQMQLRARSPKGAERSPHYKDRLVIKRMDAVRQPFQRIHKHSRD